MEGPLPNLGTPTEEAAIAQLVKERSPAPVVTSGDDAPGTSLTAVTFNTGLWGGGRSSAEDSAKVPRLLKEVLKDVNTDLAIVALQEVPSRGWPGAMSKAFDDALDQYDVSFIDTTWDKWLSAGAVPESLNFGLMTMVLTRKEWSGEVVKIDRRVRVANTYTKQSMVSALEIRDGRAPVPLLVVNTHAPFTNDGRDTIEHFGTIEPHLRNELGAYVNTILLGDFNSRFSKMDFGKKLKNLDDDAKATFDRILCTSHALLQEYHLYVDNTDRPATFRKHLEELPDSARCGGDTTQRGMTSTAHCDETSLAGMHEERKYTDSLVNMLDHLIKEDELTTLVTGRGDQIALRYNEFDNKADVSTDRVERAAKAINLFRSMREAPIDFPPSYKIVTSEGHIGRPAQITGLKKEGALRMPGFADRIMYVEGPSTTIQSTKYQACNINLLSDHLMVSCELTIAAPGAGTPATAPASPVNAADPSPDGPPSSEAFAVRVRGASLASLGMTVCILLIIILICLNA